MIEARYQIKPYSIIFSISGHAGYAEKGKDLVCAAVSCLAYTLMQCVQDWSEGLSEPPVIEMDDGYALILCKPMLGHTKRLRTMAETIKTGLEILSLSYPEYMTLTEIDEDESPFKI